MRRLCGGPVSSAMPSGSPAPSPYVSMSGSAPPQRSPAAARIVSASSRLYRGSSRSSRGATSRSNAAASVCRVITRSDVTEPVDRVVVLFPHRDVAYAEPFLGREAEHADLALVQVAVDVVRRLTRLLHRVDPRQRRVDVALGDQAVGLVRLAVVREVRADDALEVHPEVAVVVLVQEAGGARAGDDRAALA